MPTKNKRRAAFRKRLTSDPPPPDEATKAKLEAMTDAEAEAVSIEAPTLVDDFRSLYSAAQHFAEVCRGKGDARPYESHKALLAELERLAPLMEQLKP